MGLLYKTIPFLMKVVQKKFRKNLKFYLFQFDSGSALTVNGVLAGLASWGDARRCGGTEWPLVCTKVSSYLDWINNNLD